MRSGISGNEKGVVKPMGEYAKTGGVIILKLGKK